MNKKNIITGTILIILGLGLGFFTQAHRPPEGFMDALNRADSWAFKNEVYYALLFISALLGVLGLVGTISGVKK